MLEYEVLVVGAGAIGLSVAVALVEEGIGPVLVAEKSDGPRSSADDSEATGRPDR
jgi:glycine/D-amino acid oxidase-like deaminating enzyme